MSAIAALHFAFILIHQIITYACGGPIRHKMQMISIKLRILFTALLSSQQVQSFESQSDISYIWETNELEEQVPLIESSD